jgi:hypothetical protein
MSQTISNLPVAVLFDPTDEIILNQGSPRVTRRAPLSMVAATALNRQDIAGTAYTLLKSDLIQRMLVTLNASATAVTVPSDTVLGLSSAIVMPNLLVVQYGVGQASFVAGSGVTLRTSSSLTARARYSIIGLIRLAPNEWMACGDLT